MNLKLRPMTIIGATTRSGLLSAPLRDRFPVREHLDFYTIAELTRIVTINAAKLALPIDEEAATKVATASRGTPRIANNHLRWVRDYAQSRADGEATLSVTNDALTMRGVDQEGLDAQDRKYLDTIERVFHGGPAGVEAIAHTMNLPVDTLTDEVEPFLLRSELVVRTPRGRKLTPKAYDHLGKQPPESGGDRPTLF